MARKGRNTALLALLGIAAMSAGPGAVIASLALLVGDHDDHRVSMQRDLGHEDFVICHGTDTSETPTPTPTLRDADDCRDDHRLHVTRDDGLVARNDTKSAFGLTGEIAIPLPAIPAVAKRVIAPLLVASHPHEMAARLQRSIVLQV